LGSAYQLILHGKPGTGKTSFIEGLQTPKMPVLTLSCSLYEATDFSGLPFFSQDRTKFAPPEWSFYFDECENGILFFDEITTCMPAVQAALLRVILNRKVGSKSLPKNVRILAAANPADEIQSGYELTPPLANRFCHISWVMTANAFADGMTQGFQSPEMFEIDPHDHQVCKQGWQNLIASFLQLNSSLVITSPAEGELAFASPRTYDMVAALMASCELLGLGPALGGKPSSADDGTAARLAVGCIGSAAATAFLGFLQNLDLPDPAEFLSGKVGVDPAEMQDDQLFVFFNSLTTLLENRSACTDSDLKHAKKSTRMMQLIAQISACHKLDCVFSSVKRLLESSWLQQGIICCYRIEDEKIVEEFENAMRTLESTDLPDYLTTIQKCLART
jgi:hypothetical protein